ncbi:alpha/beta hydrolase [Candidatus Puniceispirillum sp.]|uniref:alpha/beta hydrolase n=1 Tax=Candidatus Puniceispirillum sp. TaxID=2026719 RepID=UPI003F6A0511
MADRRFGELSGPFVDPARGGKPSSLIVILHGWGADGNDLADLAYPFSLRFPGAAFFVPHAPELCSMNPAGRQWFDIEDRVTGPVVAAPVIEAAIAAAAGALELESNAIALTGFSQGGMMSLHCGLRMQAKPTAIVSFSGALLVYDDLMALAEDDRQSLPPVQLVHGTQDLVVPYEMMDVSAGILRDVGVEVTCIPREGLGHGIDADALTAAIDFLALHLPA